MALNSVGGPGPKWVGLGLFKRLVGVDRIPLEDDDVVTSPGQDEGRSQPRDAPAAYGYISHGERQISCRSNPLLPEIRRPANAQIPAIQRPGGIHSHGGQTRILKAHYFPR